VLEALAHEARGKRKKSFAALEQALLLGEGEGYLRVFLDEGEAMRLLIMEFQDQSKPPESKNNQNTLFTEYVGYLLAALSKITMLKKTKAS
jgi:hypothetical protein